MRHKTIQMTMRYAHLAPAYQLAAVERLISFVGAAELENGADPGQVRPVAAQPADEAMGTWGCRNLPTIHTAGAKSMDIHSR